MKRSKCEPSLGKWCSSERENRNTEIPNSKVNSMTLSEYGRKRLLTEAFFNPRLEVGEKISDKLFILRTIAYQMLEPLGFSRDFIEIAVNALFERERISTTGIGEGVAIPHGKVPMIEDILCGWFISHCDLEWQSLDCKPTHIVICLIAPENGAGDHLRLMGAISRALKSSAFRNGLLELAETTANSDHFRSIVERELDRFLTS
jgi:mannitol/fructose-specific phosphotransferase system IIA component (Ntr-type)